MVSTLTIYINMSSKKSIKRIYIVFYEPQEFLGSADINIPLKAFKSKKSAELYASTRNFEFQTISLLDEESHEQYVLNNAHNDYTITMGDLRIANTYFKEELFRATKANNIHNIWEVILEIQPFRVRPIEYSTESEFKL